MADRNQLRFDGVKPSWILLSLLLLVGLAVDAPLTSLFRMELSPCSITTLAWFADGNASMFGFSESSHLRDVRTPDGT